MGADFKFSLRSCEGKYLSAQEDGTLVCDRDDAVNGGWETFSFVQTDHGLALKSNAHKKFVCCEGGGGGGTTCDRDEPQEWESLTVEKEDKHSNEIFLKAHNGQYLCAEDGGGGEVNANRDDHGAWETFTISPMLHHCHFALKANNGQFLCCEGEKVVANRDEAAEWETFKGEQTDHGFAFKSHTDKYMCAEGGGGGGIVTDREAAAEWESFEVQWAKGEDSVYLRSHDKHYLCAEGGGGGEINCTRDDPSDWETFTFVDM